MHQNENGTRTLRLLFPQWQGGYDGSIFPGQIYPLGARLLAWLAPQSDAPLIEVPVPAWTGEPAPRDGGVLYRQALLQQVRAASKILREYAPERVITFGGDCLVSQAPFSYLNELYEGDLALLWIDAHPDITTPDDFDHAHAMVLGNLLGEGEPMLAGEVGRHVRSEQVALVGVDEVLDYERATIARHRLHVIPSAGVAASSTPVTDWLAQGGFSRAAIHLDLDVLDPAGFRSLLFTNPDVADPIDAERGNLCIRTLGRLLQDIAACTPVVGVSFAEYMPWDALNLKTMLHELPFMR
ncbi:MAG TPA: arginase family protein [Candidatus Avidesulfovibrio excrementigallinarum]|nr:arginase family protein [Candidatus Avidesulfovibrio excrementigallinarum]